LTEQPAEAPSRPPRSLAFSASFRLGTNVGVAVLNLLNVVIVARTLGPSGRGEVVLFMTIATLTSQLGLLGVQEANANYAASERRLRPALATNSLLLSLIFGCAAGGLLAGVLAIYPAVAGDLPVELRNLALASLPILIFWTYAQHLVQAGYSFALANIAWILGPLIAVAANGTFAALDSLTVEVAAASWVAGQTVAAALLAWYIARRFAGFGRPDGRLVVETLKFGLKSHPGRIMLLGSLRLDHWLVGAISGSRELGLYSVATAWSETLFYLPTSLAFVQRPDLVRLDRRTATRQAARGFRATAAITLPIAAVMALAAPFLCRTVFGPEFTGSIGDLRVLTLGAFGIAALELLGYALTAQRKPLLQTAAITIGFTCSVALAVVLIPRYGGLGAAWASSISYTVGGIAVGVIFVRALGARRSDLLPRPADLFGVWRGLQRRLRASS
jgi:O-antigen/teichoic acid export membrane protein